MLIRSLSSGIITLRRQTHNQNHTYKDTDCEDNVKVHSDTHPCPSSVSREILTLLLHHWRLHPLITSSCISRWSQARLTSLTRPLSLTMLIRMGWTLGMDVCVWRSIGIFFSLCNCQGLDDFPLACLMCAPVCVRSCHSLTYRTHRPIQHTARQVWHCMKGSVNWDGVCLCPMMRPISGS